ncbi:hypothetical protein [Alicyclobacillus kakegawensis]|uniref:hypothetical protein n=1 Tax=Alicyclobacillus kakegawensis TaxID=392012 RepID=UPI0008356E33|nr:hypothetical protein [Alicyclobacillus kakegawensis]
MGRIGQPKNQLQGRTGAAVAADKGLPETRGSESGTLSGEKRLDWMGTRSNRMRLARDQWAGRRGHHPVDAVEVGETFGGCLPVCGPHCDAKLENQRVTAADKSEQAHEGG